mmetsp:Transcript_2756/g.8225  ORF Transcript_2756/g.8225 Transcript_2756/m.8225 type:complete len:227 (-) Transcript_2756:6-686(-)
MCRGQHIVLRHLPRRRRLPRWCGGAWNRDFLWSKRSGDVSAKEGGCACVQEITPHGLDASVHAADQANCGEHGMEWRRLRPFEAELLFLRQRPLQSTRWPKSSKLGRSCSSGAGASHELQNGGEGDFSGNAHRCLGSESDALAREWPRIRSLPVRIRATLGVRQLMCVAMADEPYIECASKGSAKCMCGQRKSWESLLRWRRTAINCGAVRPISCALAQHFDRHQV